MSVEIIQGDALEVLRGMDAESVHCCVTSPPYWGLRDYGTAEWDGGDGECDHRELRGGIGASSAKQVTSAGASTTYQFRGQCKKCGAFRIDRQLGLEGSPDEYVEKMVAIFSEVRRVLRGDGTLWLNLGDSYAAHPGQRKPSDAAGSPKQVSNAGSVRCGSRSSAGLKPKDLVGIPWMVAFALRAAGWYLRQDIIWHKPNPMPESVTDRCTKSHEYIFLMSKSERYYFNQEAILEPVSPQAHARLSQEVEKQISSERAHAAGDERHRTKAGLVKYAEKHRKLAKAGSGIKNNESFNDAVCLRVDERNKRSVWTVTTKPYKAAHFATFPPDLIKPCILAGCPEGGTVLDPFLGSGTTAMVAQKNGCNCIGIELNPEYVKLAKRRIQQRSLLTRGSDG